MSFNFLKESFKLFSLSLTALVRWDLFFGSSLLYSSLGGEMRKVVVFIQYGDYRESAMSFLLGGEETYNAQRYSVDIVEGLPRICDSVVVIGLNSEPGYKETLPSGVVAYGIKLWKGDGKRDLIEILELISPTHIVLRTPYLPVIRWAIKNNVDLFPILADSFGLNGIKAVYKNWQLKRALNHASIRFVANHNVASSKNLVAIGVDSNKIVPWDWPSLFSPSDFLVKKSLMTEGCVKLLYVGNLSFSKGISDCIEAVKYLNDIQVRVELDVVGSGQDLPKLLDMVERLSLHDSVRFVGKVPHKEVINIMREHDIVIVPSRASYPEGLPMVIYEALCSRTPLILSTHPMFCSRFENNVDAAFFEAGNPVSLGNSIKDLVLDKARYSELSSNSGVAWERIQCPVMWGDMLMRWLDGSQESSDWLSSYTVGHYSYS